MNDDIVNRHQIAELTQLSNDLFWKFYDGEDGFIRWSGYNDTYWWDNVSLSDSFKQKVGKNTGRVFELDAKTGIVSIRTIRKTDK